MKTTQEIVELLNTVPKEMYNDVLTLWIVDVIDTILEDPSMIYYDGAEAVYSYEAFEKFKKQLI